MQQAYKFEWGQGSCGQVECYCQYDEEFERKYMEELNEYDKTLVEKWIHNANLQPLEKVPENALSIPRCRSCRYTQAYFYEHGKDILEVCNCKHDDDYIGCTPDAEEHPLVLKWLGKETKSEEETDESSASKQQQ